MREERPRVSIDREKAARLTDRFVHALRDANVEELRVILATDVVVVADSGGKVNAIAPPVHGIENVVRLLSTRGSTFWSELTYPA